MRKEVKEFDGEKYIFDVPENEKDAILLELRKVQTYWTEKSQEERIADYILTLVDRNTKQVRKEVCEEIRNRIENYSDCVLEDYENPEDTALYGVFKNILEEVEEVKNQIQGETK